MHFVEVVTVAVAPATCATWLSSIDDAYTRVADARHGVFVAESSSFRLPAIEGLTIDAVWTALSTVVRQGCADLLGPAIEIDADQCWVRRQFAPAMAPDRHRPHSWHQDGALGYDFSGHAGLAPPADALLRMVTFWIALTPCGVDAPGLELVTEPIDELLLPSDLREAAVDESRPAARRVRPVMGPGDVAIFTGDVLHRTHRTTSMTRTRTSIELRCFPADGHPDRLRADHFVTIIA